MEKLTVAKYLHFLKVDNDAYIGWNRYHPSIFILNKAALDLLDRIAAGKTIPRNNEIDYFLEEFKKYRFIFRGDTDPSKEDFCRMVRQAAAETESRAAQFYREKEDYDDLKIVGNACNLACPYCINNYKKEESPCCEIKDNKEKKLEIIEQCIDRYIARKIESPAARLPDEKIKEAKIFFNGGEILLEWPLIKEIIERNQTTYKNKGIKITYEINTNLTLLTEAMARFFKKHRVAVHISIDGYREIHNRTRKYHDGRGSFDDIIEKLAIYRKYNGKNSLPTFQGTIEFPDDFSPEEVYKMERCGFLSARLAPNLLAVSEENARRKAQIMGRFLELNTRHKFQVTELIFTRLKDKINREEYCFTFNCPGLSALPRMSIELNISTMSLSHLCGFVRRAAVSCAEIGYDIYNPKLWDVSAHFIKERLDVVSTDCLECELVGICAGGCVLAGLDIDNRVNKAACAYEKEMWKIYVKKAYQDS